MKSLAGGFDDCTFLHVSHDLNVVAHELARSCGLNVNLFYRGVILDCIRDELYNDVH